MSDYHQRTRGCFIKKIIVKTMICAAFFVKRVLCCLLLSLLCEIAEIIIITVSFAIIYTTTLLNGGKHSQSDQLKTGIT